MPFDFDPDGSSSGSGSGSPKPEVYPVTPVVPIYNNQGGSNSSNNTQTSRERGFPERVNLQPLGPAPSIDKAGVLTNLGNFDPSRDIVSSLYTGAGDVLGKPLAIAATALGKQDALDSAIKTIDSIPGAGIITGSYARALGNEPLVTAWKKYGRMQGNALIDAADNPTLGYNLNDMGTDIGRLTTFVMLGALAGGPLGAAIGGGIALAISAIGLAAQGLASLNPFDNEQSYLDDLEAKQNLYNVGVTLNESGVLGQIAKVGAGMIGADFNKPIRTVDDLREQLMLNGFTEEDLQFILDRPDQVGVINLDPRTLLSLDTERREFGQGKYGGGSAMMAGMGGLVNLVGSGSGAAFKAVTTGTKLSTKGGLAMPLVNKLIKTEQRIVGATAAAELRAAGLIPEGTVNVAESIAAIERGAIAELTVQGAAGWMASKSSGMARGVRIYARTAVGSYVGTGLASLLPGEEEGGFIPNDIAGFIDSSWAYNPLRNSELISIGAALDIPTVARGFDWWRKVPSRGLNVSLDESLIVKIADDNIPVDELKGMSRSQKRERVYALFGTKENYDKYINMLMIQVAARGSQKHGLNGLVLPYLDGIKIKAGSSLSLQAAAQEIGELASKRAEVLRRDGKITEAMLLDIATDWNNNAGDFAIISGGVARPGRLQGVHQQWINWQEAYRPLVDHGNAVGTVVLGVRRSAIVKENLAAIEAVIDLSNYEKLSDAGKRTFIANLVVTKMPRLIDTKLELIGEATANFFIRAMMKGSDLPSKEELLGRIRAIKAKAPTYDELFEGEAIREAAGKNNVPGIEAVSAKTTSAAEVITPVDDVLERVGVYGPATTARLETVAPEVNETVDVMSRALVATDLARTVAKVETRFGSTKGGAVAPLIRLTLESAERKTVAAIATIAFASNPKAKVAIVATTGEKMASMGLEANGTRVAFRTAEKLSPLKKATLDRIVERASAAGIDIVSDTRGGNITIYFDSLPEQVIKDKVFKKVINDLRKAFDEMTPEEIVEPANIKRYTSRKELLDEAQELETTGKVDPTIPNGLGWVERLRSEGTPYPAATEGEVARQARGNRPVSVAAAFSDLNKALDDVTDTTKLETAIGNWLDVVTSVPASRIGLIADELGDLGTRLRALAYKNSPLVAEMDVVVNQIVNLPEIAGDIGVASAIASLDLAAQFASTGERAGLVAKRNFVSVEQIEESITIDPAFNQVRQNADEAEAVASLDEVLTDLIAEGVASPEQVATSELLKSKTGQLRQEGQFITTKGGKQVRIPQKAALDYFIRSGMPIGALEAANDTIIPVPPAVAKATVSRQQIVVESNKTLAGKGWMVAKGFAPSGINHVPAETAASFLISKGIKGIPEVVNDIGPRPKSAGAKATRKVQQQVKAAQVAWDKANMANITKKAKVYEKLFEYVYGFKRSAAMEQGKFDPQNIKIKVREISDEDLSQLGLRREGNEIYRVLSVDAPGGTKLELAVGDVSTEAFMRQIEQAFNVKAGQPETYLEAFRHANWYQDFRKAIELFYGKDRLGKAVLYAFIHSQQAEGVVNGFAAVASIYRTMLVGLTDLENASKYLRTSRSFKAKQQYALMIGKKKVSEAIFTALNGQPVAYGPGAKKITDFADSFLGKKARTVLGNSAVDSMPVAVDRHTISNTGFVDMRVAKSAAYGGGVNPELTKPGIIANEFQYEWSVEKVNQWTRDLNAQGWLGRTDWTAAEIQALGWYHFKKVIGDFSGTVADAIEGSSASLLIDLVPSKNSPTLQKLMPDLSGLSDDQIRVGAISWVNSDAVTRLAQENGVAIAARTVAGEEFAQRPTVIGISKAGSTPTITVDVVGAPEAITSFMRDLAVAAEQDFAIAWASLPRGVRSVEDATKKGLYNVRPTVDIPLPPGVSVDSAIESIRKVLSSDEEIREIYAAKGMDRFQIDDLLSGNNRRMAFAVVPDTINGEGHVRIIDTNFNLQAKTNYDIAYENYSVHDHLQPIASISNKIADKLGLPRPVHRSYQTPDYPFHRRLAERYYEAPETKNYETGRVIEGNLGPATDYNWTVRTDTNLEPEFAAAAQEFLNELREQYDALYRAGYRFEAHAVDPYNVGSDFVGSPGVPVQLMGSGDIQAGNKGVLAQTDLRDNKHLFVFGSYPSNPAFSDEINVLFRAVHDTFGHLTDGYSFGPQGELNALIKHMQMFKSKGARKVALVELGGQNAMTNFGYAERLADGSYVTVKNADDFNRAKAAGTLVRGEEIPSIPARPFATQKSFLIEDEFLSDFERLYLPTEAALTVDELELIAMKSRDALSNLTDGAMIRPHSTSLVATTGVSNDWAKFPDAREYKRADVFAESGVRRLVASSGKESAAEFAPRISAVQDEFFAARKAETESRYAAGMEGPVGEARRALVAAFTEAAPEETAIHRAAADEAEGFASFSQTRDIQRTETRRAQAKAAVQQETEYGRPSFDDYLRNSDETGGMPVYSDVLFTRPDTVEDLLGYMDSAFPNSTGNPITEAEFSARVADGELVLYRGVTRKGGYELEGGIKGASRRIAESLIDQPNTDAGMGRSGLYGAAPRGYWATDYFTTPIRGTAEEVATRYAQTEGDLKIKPADVREGVMIKATLSKDANVAILDVSDSLGSARTEIGQITINGVVVNSGAPRIARTGEIPTPEQLATLPPTEIARKPILLGDVMPDVFPAVGKRTIDIVTGEEVDSRGIGYRPFNYDMITAFAIREGLDAVIIRGGERAADAAGDPRMGDQLLLFNADVVNVVDPRLEGKQFNKIRPGAEDLPAVARPSTGPKFVMGDDIEVRAPMKDVEDTWPILDKILDDLTKDMDIAEPIALANIIDEVYYLHKGKLPRRVAPEDFNPDRYGSVVFRGLGSGGVSTTYTSKEMARFAGLDAINGKPKMFFGNVGYGNYWALSDPQADQALGPLLRKEQVPPVKTAETYAGRFPEQAGQITEEQAKLYDLYKSGKMNIDTFNEQSEVLARSTGELGTVTPFKPSGVIDYASPVTEEAKGIVLQAGLASDARVFKYKESAALALADANRSPEFNKLFSKWMSEVVNQTIDALNDGDDGFRLIQDEMIDIQEVLEKNMNNPEILDEVVGDLFRLIASGSDRIDRPTDLVIGKTLQRAFNSDTARFESFAENFGEYVARATHREMSVDEGWATIYAMTHGYDAMQAVDRLEMKFGQPQVLSVFNQAALEIVDPTLSGGTLNMIRKSSTASKAEVLGRTTYVDKGKSLVQLFKGKADLSTVIHEMAHTWLNTGWLPDSTLFDIADALGIKYARTRTGANKLRIDGRLNEEFAQQFEAYVTKGDWAGTPLEDSFRLLSNDMQRIYAGVDGQVPDINPDVALVFEKIFESAGAEKAAGVAHGPSTLAALTRAEADLTATGDLELVERLAQMDIDAGNIPGNRPPHWDGRTHGLSADYLETLAPIQRKLDAENSPYTITGAPQLAVTPTTGESVSQYVSSGAKWRATTIGKVIEKTKIDRLFNTVGWLLEKPTAINEAQATRQFLYRELISKGATVDMVNELIAKLNEKRTQYYHSFAATYSLKSMGYGAITKAVTEVFEGTDEGRQFLKNIGGEAGVVRAIERSASKIYKKVDSDTVRNPGFLTRVLATTYRTQQRIPFLRGGLRMVRWAYPTLRFYLDPRWHALNAFEADIILGSQFGLKATRFGGAKDALPDLAFLKHAGLIDERLYAIDPRKAIRDAVAQATGAKDLKAPKGQFDVETLLGEHGGGFHDTRDQRGLSGRFTRALEKIRENNARRVVATVGIDPDEDVLRATGRALDEHGELDPYIVNLRKIAEERQKPLTKVLDEELYLIDTLGFDEAMNKLEAKALTYEERELLRPMLQRLYDMNQESYNNMLALVRGNPNRTNIEKIINNYFLYWPASYMIKATKWMMTTLMTHNGELSGVNVVRAEQFAEAHYRAIADNPDYRAMYEDNPAAWRLATMFLPVSPILSEIGASLGRPTRYLGGAIGVFPKYRASEDPGVFFESVTSYGIGYTSEILQEVYDELTADQP
jgi:hypothetical protein